MTLHRNDIAGTHAGKIIALFLERTNGPKPEDWVALIARHPECAGEIAEMAMLLTDAQPLVEADLGGPLDKAAYEANVSWAVSLLHTTPSPVLAELETKVKAAQGPTARQLAAEVGLGAAPPLLSSIMVGSVVAPSQVLSRLALKFETSVLALAELFSCNFANKAMPAFKAANGKPHVPGAPVTWREAVMSFKLSPKQTQELLDLDN